MLRMHWRSALWLQPGCLLRRFDDDHFQQPYGCLYYRPDEEGLVDLHTGAGSVGRDTRMLKWLHTSLLLLITVPVRRLHG